VPPSWVMAFGMSGLAMETAVRAELPIIVWGTRIWLAEHDIAQNSTYLDDDVSNA